jgi:hypothetical protein
MVSLIGTHAPNGSSMRLPVSGTWDDNINNLYRATKLFEEDRYDGECYCLDGKTGVAIMPGESFLLAENEEAFGLSLERPTAQSILDLIDELVHPDMWLEAESVTIPDEGFKEGMATDSVVETDVVEIVSVVRETPHTGAVFEAVAQQSADFGSLQPSTTTAVVVEEREPSPGMFFDCALLCMVEYMALSQLLSASDILENPYHTDLAVGLDLNVSDMSDYEGDHSLMTQPSELNFFDADTQQYVTYTAFNQLLQFEDEDVLPRIHRTSDADDHLDLFTDIREISNQFLDNCTNPSTLRITNGAAVDDSSVGRGNTQLPTVHRPAQTYYASLLGSKRPYRPRLMMQTKLSPIFERDDEDDSCCSSPSSPDSLDFEGHRDYVKPLIARRIDFLDDEEDYCEQVTTFLGSPEDFVFVTEFEECFSNDIWQSEPNLMLSLPGHAPLIVTMMAAGQRLPDRDFYGPNHQQYNS